MAHEQEKNPSVYDFLYVDTKRVASFLSQFSSDGHLTELTRSVETNDENELGTDVKIFKGSTTSGSKESIAKRHDPQWIAPLSFLEELQSRDFIKKEISKARTGQIVLVEGQLRIFDPSIFGDMMKLPSLAEKFKKLAIAGIEKQAKEKAAETHNTTLGLNRNESTEFMLELMQYLPYAPQAFVSNNTWNTWGLLQKDGLTSSAADMVLKHGDQIAGEWTMVGILDGMANDVSDEKETQFKTPLPPDSQNPQKTMMGFLNKISHLARKIIGRPKDAYAVTPLLIFRAISE